MKKQIVSVLLLSLASVIIHQQENDSSKTAKSFIFCFYEVIIMVGKWWVL